MDSALSKPEFSKEDEASLGIPVDFQGDGGLLYHGKIVSGMEDGVLVEMPTGKIDRSTQLVPYGKVFFCEKRIRPELLEVFTAQHGRMLVEVLVGLVGDHELQWYPAILIRFDDGTGTFGVASIVLPGLTVKVVVPANRIRTRLTEWVAVTRQDCRELAAESKKYNKTDCSLQRDQSKISANIRHIKHQEPDRDVLDESGIQALPTIILTEIFECLDSPVRCRYRNVCSHWNAVLTRQRILKQLRLNYSGRVHSEEEEKAGYIDETYLNAFCASKCWAPTIIITGFSDDDEAVSFSADRFCRIMQEFGHPSPRTILVSNLHWSMDFYGSVETEVKTLAAVCQTLLLQKVTAFVDTFIPAAVQNSHSDVLFQVHITNGRLVGGQQLSSDDWWNMFVNGFPKLTEDELTAILDGMAENRQDKDGSVEWEDILQDLLGKPKEFPDIPGWCAPSHTTHQMYNLSAKDAVKLELQKLPNIAALRFFQTFVYACTIWESILSW